MSGEAELWRTAPVELPPWDRVDARKVWLASAELSIRPYRASLRRTKSNLRAGFISTATASASVLLPAALRFATFLPVYL